MAMMAPMTQYAPKPKPKPAKAPPKPIKASKKRRAVTVLTDTP